MISAINVSFSYSADKLESGKNVYKVCKSQGNENFHLRRQGFSFTQHRHSHDGGGGGDGKPIANGQSTRTDMLS